MTVDLETNTDDSTVRFFFIRHGQTNHNVQKIIQGHVDIDINDTGVHQAKLLGKKLSHLKFDNFVSSDLIRCINTSKEIMVFQDCNFRTTPALRERNMGIAQGLHIKEAIARFGDDYRNQGETQAQLITRLKDEFDIMVENSIEENYLNVAICSHGGSITTFFNYLHNQGFKLNGLTPQDLRVPYNTSVSVVDIDKRTKTGVIHMFGNTKHLGADLLVQDQRLR